MRSVCTPWAPGVAKGLLDVGRVDGWAGAPRLVRSAVCGGEGRRGGKGKEVDRRPVFPLSPRSGVEP